MLNRIFVGGLGVALSSGACTMQSQNGEQENIATVEQPAQCGATWDAPDVELYDGSIPGWSAEYVARYQGAFGRHCSGTMISPDLFVTVEHDGCPVEAGESVLFNCQVSAADPNPPDPVAAANARCESFSAIEVSHYSSVDVSVSRLAGNPGAKYGFVFPTARPLLMGEDIAIFQHPLGQGRRKVVGFGTVGSLTNDNVGYGIDTTGGSSGAGVLDRHGLLVAVHRASGCEVGGLNQGTPMTDILNDVPEIRSVVAATWAVVVL